MHGQAAGCTFYEPMRPDGAQNNTLISNTVKGQVSYTVAERIGDVHTGPVCLCVSNVKSATLGALDGGGPNVACRI